MELSALSWTGAVLLVCCGLFADVAEGVAEPFSFAAYPECNDTGVKPHSPEVPKLALQFTIKVEGKMYNAKGDLKELFDSDGYYDADGQRGATFVHSRGRKSTFLYDFTSGEAFDIDGTCNKTDLYEHGCNAYAIFIAELAGHTNVSERCQFISGNVTFIGDEVVRGIPVRTWKQCVHDMRQMTVSVSYYYFNKDGYPTPSGSKDVPIRFASRVIANTTDVNPNSTYDFTYYDESVEDMSVFIPASGLFCPTWNRENKTIPQLADQFSLTMLTVAHVAKEAHSVRMSFDFGKQLVSFVTDNSNNTSFPPTRTSKTAYRTVHDYASGLAFVTPWDAWVSGSRKCNISAIDNTSLESDSSSSSVHLLHAYQLFGMNHSGWQYVGEREFNEMPCYIWASQEVRDGQTFLTEIYFMQEKYTSTKTPAFVGMMVYEKFRNGSDSEVYRSVISDYSALTLPWRSFDVESCLRTGHSQPISFCLKVQDYAIISQRVNAFEGGLRSALASLLGISQLRIGSISVFRGEKPEVDEPHVMLTIFPWTDIPGSNPNATKQNSVGQAVQDLKNRMTDKDFELTVYYGGKNQTVTFLRNSLRSGAEVLNPTTPAASVTTTAPLAPLIQEGYTGGSMAGLAISMILIGGVAGLVAGFLMWKRNTGIAYQVYE